MVVALYAVAAPQKFIIKINLVFTVWGFNHALGLGLPRLCTCRHRKDGDGEHGDGKREREEEGKEKTGYV